MVHPPHPQFQCWVVMILFFEIGVSSRINSTLKLGVRGWLPLAPLLVKRVWSHYENTFHRPIRVGSRCEFYVYISGCTRPHQHLQLKCWFIGNRCSHLWGYHIIWHRSLVAQSLRRSVAWSFDPWSGGSVERPHKLDNGVVGRSDTILFKRTGEQTHWRVNEHVHGARSCACRSERSGRRCIDACAACVNTYDVLRPFHDPTRRPHQKLAPAN